MKVLLTGGAGYVGSACLRWLLRHGHDAVAIDNMVAGNRGAVPEDRLIVGDVRDTEKMEAVMGTHGTEAVMHFAALASVPDSIKSPMDYWDINVGGTRSVLNAMLSVGVKRLVFSSTAATYSFNEPMPLVEESYQRPEVPYGTTKLASEQMIRDYASAYGIAGSILRYFNASGADPDGKFGEDHRPETHLLPLILQTAEGRRDEFVVYGTRWPTPDGSCIRDFVHTDDLGQAHELAVRSVREGEISTYNVGTGMGTSVLEVLKACEAVVGRSIQYRVAEPRPGDPPVLVASPKRLMDLGWIPKFPNIREIVETAWRWHSSHPEGYSNAPD